MSVSNFQVGRTSVSFPVRVLILLGFALSLGVLLLPFYSVGIIQDGYDFPGYAIYYWSFKASISEYSSPYEFIRQFALDRPIYYYWIPDIVDAVSHSGFYFNAYWLNREFRTGGFSVLLITLFAMQLLTLGMSFLSLFKNRKVVRLATVLLGATIPIMMFVFMLNVPSKYSFPLSRAELSFWLAVLAEIVFMIGLAL